VTLVGVEEGESKEAFKKRIKKLLRERGLISDDKEQHRPDESGGKDVGCSDNERLKPIR
jgi:hypothetical protein